MGLTNPKEGTVIENAAEIVERSQQLIRNSNLQQAIMEEKKQIREERSKRHQEWMQEVQRLRGLKGGVPHQDPSANGTKIEDPEQPGIVAGREL